MNTRWLGWGWAALGLVLMAAAVQAGESAAQAEVRVELKADSSAGAKPEVRMWVNGKEVTGDSVAVEEGGGVRLQPRSSRGGEGGPQPFLGVQIAPLTDQAREAAKVEAGALVTEARPGSPAERAGLKADDVITAVNGEPVDGPQQLVEQIRGHRAGDKVKLAWVRQGNRMEASVTLGASPEAGGRREEPQRADRPKPPRTAEAYLGVWVVPLSKETEELAGTDHGVLVSSLAVDGPAAKAGLQAGDVIVSMDGKDVAGPDQFVDRLRAHKPGDTVPIGYFRAGKRNEASATLGERPAELGRKEGVPGLDVPEELWGNLGQLLEKLGPEVGDLMKKWGEGRQGLRPGAPAPVPELPRLAPRQEPYDMGKDMGRLLERLDGIEKRLNDIDQRLRKLEK